jgi:hypothetical protein
VEHAPARSGVVEDATPNDAGSIAQADGVHGAESSFDGVPLRGERNAH